MTVHVFEALRVPPASWRPADADRPYSPFKATYSTTLNELATELWAIEATRAVIRLDTAAGNVNRDGSMRADAVVRHPGVELVVEAKGLGTLTYSTDKYAGWSKRPGWQANLRAIVLGLHDLRRLERYGIAERGQQYAGFGALPPATAMGPAMSFDEAAALLATEAWGQGTDPQEAADDPKAAYRAASKKHHPDAGGDDAMFRRLGLARELLERG